MLRLFAAFLVVALAACTSTPRPGVHAVHWDDGGIIELYEAHIDELAEAGTLVQIGKSNGKGYCASACTMYLGLKNACVWPNTHFEFHGAIPFPGQSKAEYDAIMASYYTPELRKWYYSKAVRLLGWGRDISTEDVQRMTGVPTCTA